MAFKGGITRRILEICLGFRAREEGLANYEAMMASAAPLNAPQPSHLVSLLCPWRATVKSASSSLQRAD
jgi:hypothetical protein